MRQLSEQELLCQIQLLEKARRRWKYGCIVGLGFLAALFLLSSSSYSQPDSQEKQASSGWKLDTGSAKTVYANYFKIDGTPEELVMDFGLIPTAQNPAAKPIKIETQLVMSFYSAKRLLSALEGTIADHEKVFGVIETDIRKRAKQ